MITLSTYPGLGDSLVLPSPEWQDTVTPDNVVNILRTMNGDYWSYVKKSDIRIVEYALVLMDRKAAELRDFYRLTAGELLALTDHREAVYVGTLREEPLTLSNDRRGLYCEDEDNESTEVVNTNLVFIGVAQ